MSDIALTWDRVRNVADLSITSNDLTTDDGLRTAVILSVYCDRQADESDVLPDGSTDRRGWWADEFADVNGDKIGSRLWLLERSKNTPDVLSRAVAYAREALQWLVDDGAASAVNAVASFITRTPTSAPFGYELDLTVVKPDGNSSTFKFPFAWAAEAARLPS